METRWIVRSSEVEFRRTEANELRAPNRHAFRDGLNIELFRKNDEHEMVDRASSRSRGRQSITDP